VYMRASGIDADSDQLNPVSGEFQDVGGRAAFNEEYDLLGRLEFGVNGQIYAPIGEGKMRWILKKTRISDPGDLLFHTVAGGHAAGQDVLLVISCDGDHHVGLFDAGFFENPMIASLALENLDVHAFVRFATMGGVYVDGDDIVVFMG